MNLFIGDFLELDADEGLMMPELLELSILEEFVESFKFDELLLPTPPPRLNFKKERTFYFRN